jgi:hypothetical protein
MTIFSRGQMPVTARLIAIIFVAILLSSASARAATSCEIEGARYVLRDAPSFVAEFTRAAQTKSAHKLLLTVSSAETKRSFVFTINRGNGYGDATISPIEHEMATRVAIYTVNDAGDFVDYFGDIEGAAPKQLFMPSLGQALWYEIDRLTGGKSDLREQMPVAFFDRVSCGAAKP